MITLQCPCGHVLNVPDDAFGGRATCRACGRVLEVPMLGVPVGLSAQSSTSAQSAAQPADDSDRIDMGRVSQIRHATPAPDYVDVLKGAKWLRFLASILNIFGVLCFVAAAWFVYQALKTVSLGIVAMPMAVVLSMYGMALIIAGALVRMLAALALTIRDMARNSFAQH